MSKNKLYHCKSYAYYKFNFEVILLQNCNVTSENIIQFEYTLVNAA